MQKYFTIFTISWQNEFTYRLNFILWRFRNVLRLLMTYFLWTGIFVSQTQVFGYQKPQMLTYVFMVLVVQTVVLSAPSGDNIGNEIGNGDLSNFLVKPVNYLKYWFSRDIASKLLNITFASVEVVILWFFLNPVIEFTQSLIFFIAFLIAISFAVLIYYFINVTTRFIAFWTPENTWPIAFFMLVLIEILSGGIFPLDVLPEWLNVLLQLTPFPYMLYFPIAIFLGKVTGLELIRILLQSLIWVIVSFLLMNYLWKKGLKSYGSEGR